MIYNAAGIARAMLLASMSSAFATPQVAPTPVTTAAPATAAIARWQHAGSSGLDSTPRIVVLANRKSGVVAIRPQSGAIVWRNRTLCDIVEAARIVDGSVFAGCHGGKVSILRIGDGSVVRSVRLPIDGIREIVPAGKRAIAIDGWTSGAAISADLRILNATTLRQINKHEITDSTFLGTIGERAYIDDWCCSGRGDVYRPATLYWISLVDGSQSAEVDLAPDPQEHSGPQPLGQGGNNFLIGKYFYVPVGAITYRYDVTNLKKPPVKFRLP